MFGGIMAAIGNIFDSKRNATEIVHLRQALSQVVAENGQNQGHIQEIMTKLNDHERRLLYLEMWRECQGDCGQKIKDLKEIQRREKVRVKHLEQKIMADTFPDLDKLKEFANEDEKREVQNMRNQVQTYLTRARNKVGLN